MTFPPPPPPPPAAPAGNRAQTATTSPQPPAVTAIGPPGTFKIELLIFNGYPYMDHWAYWVGSHSNPDIGVLIHAVGDVRNGFSFQIKRSHNFEITRTFPTKRISLQWVDGKHFSEQAMLNNGVLQTDNRPVCAFDTSGSLTGQAISYATRDRLP